eukprot:5335964-Amphidinium_carterae.1
MPLNSVKAEALRSSTHLTRVYTQVSMGLLISAFSLGGRQQSWGSVTLLVILLNWSGDQSSPAGVDILSKKLRSSWLEWDGSTWRERKKAGIVSVEPLPMSELEKVRFRPPLTAPKSEA